MKKLFLAMVTIVVLLFGANMLSVGAATVASGSCGENLTWIFDDAGKLTISGSGDMTDYSEGSDIPWKKYNKRILSLVVEGEVSSIGDWAFSECINLERVTLSNNIVTIGEWAFASCQKLTDIQLPFELKTISDFAFYGCNNLTTISLYNDISNISEWAFMFCYKMDAIYFAGTSVQWESTPGTEALKNVSFYAEDPECIVKYNTNGGSAIASEIVSVGDIVTEPEKPIKDGYRFDGWFTDEGLTKAFDFNTPVISSISLYAKWTDMALGRGSCGENLTWVLNADGSLVITGTGEMQDYSESVKSPWYNHIANVKTVEIADGITSVGDYAFNNCTELVSVKIPTSISSVGDKSFGGCTKLNVYYQGTPRQWNAISLGSNAFTVEANIQSLGKYTVVFNSNGAESGAENQFVSANNKATEPENPIKDGYKFDGWFADETLTTKYDFNTPVTDNITLYAKWTDLALGRGTCGENLTWVLSAEGKLTISGTGEMANYQGYAPYAAPWINYQNNINSVEILPGVTTIGAYAFYACLSLESVTIPEGVTTIGMYAFFNSKLETITLPDSLTTVGNSAFAAGPTLKSIYVSSENKIFSTVDGVLFNKAKTIIVAYPTGKPVENYTIPDGVTSVFTGAFNGCSLLKSITIPDSLTSVDGRTFSLCGNLERINISAENQTFSTVDGVLFDKTKTTLIFYPYGKPIESYSVPAGVTAIGDYAFYMCITLQNITIPEGVTTIGNYAFYGASNLETITIPDSVTTLGGCAFYLCTSLKSAEIGDGITQLNSPFLNNTSLKSVTLGKNITSVTSSDFQLCTSLENIIISPENETLTAEGMALFDKTKTTLIGYIGINPDLATNYTVPKGVTTIGASAFSGCTSLKSITLPNSVTAIGQSAFRGCTSLESIILSDGLTNIGQYAFQSCISLKSIIIPGGVTIIDQFTFSGCSSLENVVISNGVKQIGTVAFIGCTALKSITIPDSVTRIANQAFYNCTSLESITIGTGLTTYLPSNAFYNCPKIKDVYYTGTPRQWESTSYYYHYLVKDGVTLHITGKYSVAFNTNGGGTIETQSVKPDEKATEPKKPTRLGYKFEGWFKDEALTTAFDFNTAIDDDITLYAKWTDVTLANGTCGESVTWILDTDGTLTISGTGEMSGYAFGNVYGANIKKVIIEKDVTGISDSAFEGCYLLETVIIPDSVKNIGASAFSGCETLISVIIPDGVTNIKGRTFFNCYSLAIVAIPDGVTAIGDYAFANCESLTSITIPESVTTIGQRAFDNCGLKSIKYKETKRDWDKITIESGNDILSEVVFKKIIISYDANGGQGEIPEQIKNNGETFALSNTVPERNGYTFEGWATSQNGNAEYLPGGTFSSEADVVLYAIWEIKKYTISYDANGGIEAPASQTKNHGTDVVLDDKKPMRTGYIFKGWATSQGGNAEYDGGESFSLDSDTVLYAVWEPGCELYVNGNKIRFGVGQPVLGKIIVGLYSADGKMKELQPYDAVDGIDVTFSNLSTGDYAKVFCWESISSAKPMFEEQKIILK